MGIIQLTRADDSPVVVMVGEIVSFAPVPTDGPMAGPLKKGTRIVFRNQTHQDVKEELETVASMVSAALSGGIAAAALQGGGIFGAALGGTLANVGGNPNWPGRPTGGDMTMQSVGGHPGYTGPKK